MTYDEFQDWDSYVKLRGTLNLGMRLEWLLGRLSAQVHHAAGGKLEFEEFLRYHGEAKTSLDSVAKLMGVKKVVNNGK